MSHYYDNIQHIISTHTTLLTPNRRLAATLHKMYQQHQLKNGQQSWQTADILPIQNWFQRVFDDYLNQFGLDSPLLLTAFQERMIWEKIILSTEASLLQLSKTIEIVQAAWLLIKQWGVDINQPLFKVIDDCKAFQEWAFIFQQNCKTNHWLDQASLPDVICKHIKTKRIVLVNDIVLVGLTELPPQWKKLFAAIHSQGLKITHHSSITWHNSHVAFRTSFTDQETEITTMARWAKTMAKHKPNARMGCVLPSLEMIRDNVLNIFSTVFSDEKTYGMSANYPFNISAGKSLTAYPIIHTALLLLKLYKQVISTELMSYLLRSPFLGEAECERIRRAQLDSLLRKKNLNVIYLQSLNEQESFFVKKCPLLSKRIRAFLSFIQREKKMNTYSRWVEIVSEMLSLLGWPGERSLNSDEYQVVNSWFKTIAQLASLDYINQAVDITEALQALYTILDQTVFQIQTPETSIQILGTLEAASLPFDYLWVAGMDDHSWPPYARPNPFIPRRIQRELEMPHATPERELFYCQQLIAQFKCCGEEIIFSHAETSDDVIRQASPLIKDVPTHSEGVAMQALSEVANHHESHIDRIYLSRILEKLCDPLAPSLQTNEIIHGGVNVIKQQALCPFKAFAETRLYAKPLEPLLPGLRAKDRGTFVHIILEKIWEKIRDHETLVKLDDTKLNELIAESIQVIEQIPDARRRKRYYTLEKQRLHRLVYSWLQLEKERQPFTVSMQEKSVQLQLDKLTLSIRIDRIDELAFGQKLIIDYKTGKNNHISHWFGDRPEDPQLPLYALFDPDHTIGVSFAELIPGGCGFKGISKFSVHVQGITNIAETKLSQSMVWEEQILQWKTILNTLGSDFYNGVAHVDPKNSQVCLWCELKPLCRINEVRKNDH